MSKDKWVRRFSVDETSKHNNGFTIYKIMSILFPIESPEAVTAISVWKRYSDIQRLHKSMKSLHAGLHLRGTFPALPRYSYFRRFQPDVITDRARTIKTLLEFIAEHRLLFTSTDFVNFLQTGYPEPCAEPGVINSIRSSLHLPIEETPPLEYPTDDDEARTPNGSINPTASQQVSRDETDFISQIPIYEAADVEVADLSEASKRTGSLDSLDSLESIDSDLFDELAKLTIDKPASSVKRNVLPDLINFDEPSTSKIDDCHTTRTGNTDSDSLSLNAQTFDSALSPSHAGRGTRTEDSYIFEAGYMLNLAARCEDAGDYAGALDHYKAGIEKLLVGARSDADGARRALVRQRTHAYLAHAERLCSARTQHVAGGVARGVAERGGAARDGAARSGSRAELCAYVLLGVVRPRLLLVLHASTDTCYVMKVLDKVPSNEPEGEWRRPVLPGPAPYMVRLHALIETEDSLFLVLTYAPGERLCEYVRRYAAAPAAKPRPPDLRCVLADRAAPGDDVRDLLHNSKELLLTVDRALGGGAQTTTPDEHTTAAGTGLEPRMRYRDAVPPGAVRRWAAELVTALESLHAAGVVCVDLGPANVLLGARGQALLTYFACRGGAGRDGAWRGGARHAPGALHVAPECRGWQAPAPAADYWSLGALLYQLICGYPLSVHHKTVFTSHTILQLPEELTVEEESLLTQLLTFEPAARLGAGGARELHRHPYFRAVDWRLVRDSWPKHD